MLPPGPLADAAHAEVHRAGARPRRTRTRGERPAARRADDVAGPADGDVDAARGVVRLLRERRARHARAHEAALLQRAQLQRGRVVGERQRHGRHARHVQRRQRHGVRALARRATRARGRSTVTCAARRWRRRRRQPVAAWRAGGCVAVAAGGAAGGGRRGAGAAGRRRGAPAALRRPAALPGGAGRLRGGGCAGGIITVPGIGELPGGTTGVPGGVGRPTRRAANQRGARRSVRHAW